MPDPTRQIADCRRDMAALATMWRAVAGRSAPRAKAEAEAQVFNQMVVALQSRFGRDVSPRAPQIAQEVRLLAEGVLGGGRFPDAGPGWRVDQSVTGYRPGDRIALSEEVFSRLSDVFLDRVARMAVA